ncbi:hypothetical protein SSAG_04108 [Streptomyces sp. Mg1]|nr:hypothetical protein SSAG_04108 [Streptomyces sp. Mg1]
MIVQVALGAELGLCGLVLRRLEENRSVPPSLAAAAGALSGVASRLAAGRVGARQVGPQDLKLCMNGLRSSARARGFPASTVNR